MSKTNAFRKGFTLIELLIVIVVIGILATAVLSAINPVEQIRKSQDASKKSDAAELLNALERYYATFQMYPWDKTTGSDTPPAPGNAGQTVSGQNWLTDATVGLVGVAEIKTEFTSRTNLTFLTVFLDTGTDLVRVCFAPLSKSNLAIAATGYNSTGQSVASLGTHLCVPE
mgnify:CR=1 FL=1